jgi:hypothetical protein
MAMSRPIRAFPNMPALPPEGDIEMGMSVSTLIFLASLPNTVGFDLLG